MNLLGGEWTKTGNWSTDGFWTKNGTWVRRKGGKINNINQIQIVFDTKKFDYLQYYEHSQKST